MSVIVILSVKDFKVDIREVFPSRINVGDEMDLRGFIKQCGDKISDWEKDQMYVDTFIVRSVQWMRDVNEKIQYVKLIKKR